jgi:hypothetical protein
MEKVNEFFQTTEGEVFAVIKEGQQIKFLRLVEDDTFSGYIESNGLGIALCDELGRTIFKSSNVTTFKIEPH